MHPTPSASIRVTLVSFPSGLGGPQKWFDEILPRLRARSGIMLETWQPQGPYRGLAGKLRLFRQVREHFHGNKQAVAYLSLDLDLAAQLVACLRLIGVTRIIVHSHAAAFHVRRPILHRAYRFLVRRAKARIAVSEQAGKAMFGPRFRNGGEIIPTSIDFVGLVERADVGSGGSIPSSNPTEMGRVYAFIGRLSREKCADMAIEAFRSHCKSFPDDRLMIIGDGPERARLEELAKNTLPAKTFTFTGVVQNVGALLKSEIDCVLIPSRYEGQCRVAAEAQFFDASVITSTAVPDIAFLEPHRAVRIPTEERERWIQSMANVTRKSSGATPERACRLERTSPIGMDKVAEQFACAVRRVGRPHAEP